MKKLVFTVLESRKDDILDVNLSRFIKYHNIPLVGPCFAEKNISRGYICKSKKKDDFLVIMLERQAIFTALSIPKHT